MKNIVVTACQSRSKIQFGVFLIALLLTVLLFVYPRTEIYNYYQQSQKNQLSSNALMKFGVAGVNRNYNLMEEVIRLGKLNQYFGSQDNSECTLGKLFAAILKVFKKLCQILR